MSTSGHSLSNAKDSALLSPIPCSVSPGEAMLIGNSAALERLRAQIDCAAPHIRVAAFEGASGTGKQTAARLLHHRAGGSCFLNYDAREWVQTTTSGIELPTGATLYLDRVEVLDHESQTRLLQLLRQFHDSTAAELRILVSSQESLRQMATHRQMLPDLVYRLTSVRFHLPLLQERIEDLPLLCDYWVKKFAARYGRALRGVTSASLAILARHPWPGNLRELVCVLESASLETEAEWITPENLSLPPVLAPLPILQQSNGWQSVPTPLESVEDLTLENHVRRHVGRVLVLTHGNKLRAATLLGISRSTLYRMLADNGMQL
jgi:DNA-binding NtrC family response regulator